MTSSVVASLIAAEVLAALAEHPRGLGRRELREALGIVYATLGEALHVLVESTHRVIPKTPPQSLTTNVM